MADEEVVILFEGILAPIDGAATSAQQDRIPVEEIPTKSSLFMRVHDQHIDNVGRLRPGVFKNHGSGMSTNWDKYSSPIETQAEAKKPPDNGVISLVVGAIRGVAGQSVHHTPYETTPPHARHVDVVGDKTTEVRVRLLEIYNWEIKNKAAT